MQPAKDSQANPPSSPAPAAAIMDVTPPHAAGQPAPQPIAKAQPEPVAEQSPALKTPPVEIAPPPPADQPEPSVVTPKSRKQKAPKSPGSGVGPVIFVTIFLMAALAALAIYAYSKSNSL